jgi:hypothetical protein
MENDPVMLLRILREWYWTSGTAPRDEEARAHPLWPGNRLNADGYSSKRPLWAAIDAVVGETRDSALPESV